MDINDNQQINTFLKGMNTDVSDALIDSSQYRYAENLRLVTNTDSNSGDLRPVEGTKLINDNFGNILALTSVRNKLIAMVKGTGVSIKVSEDEGRTWEPVVKNLPYEEFLQKHEDGTKETEPHFSLVTRWESDNNVKLYIADGVHQVLCVNLARKDYIINDQDNTMQDIFPYLNVPLQAPRIQVTTGGNLQSARVQYAYRLYNIGEPASTTSPLSNICSIYKSTNEGYQPEQNSNKAVRITIPQNEGKFEKLQVYRITYVILGQDPTVTLIYDDAVTDTIIDRGQEIEVQSDVEFLSATQLRTIPKVIESKEDYLFAGNVKYAQDNFDQEITDANLDFRAYSWGDFESSAPDYINFTGTRECNKQFDPDVTSNISQLRWLYWMDGDGNPDVYGGTGPIVSWRFTTDDYFIDKNNIAYPYPEGVKGSAIEGDISSLRRGEIYRFGIILYSNKGTKSSVHWIADILVPNSVYDAEKNRRAERPKPIIDGNNNLLGWWFTTIGIKFTVNIPQNAGVDIYGFDIVRCKRSYDDSFTISQGIIGQPLEYDTDIHTGNANIIFSSGFMTMENMNIGSDLTYRPNYEYVMFASPEDAYQPDDIEDIIKQNKSNLYLTDVESYYHPLSDDSHPVSDDHSGSGDSGTGLKQFKSYSEIGDNSNSLFIKSNEAVGRYKRAHIIAGDKQNYYLDSRSNGIHETAITHIAAAKQVSLFEQQSNIQDVSFPEVADPNLFYDTNKVPVWKNAVTPISGKTFIGWTCPGIYPEAENDRVYDTFTSTDTDRYEHTMYSRIHEPIGNAGKCILFKLESPRDALDLGVSDNIVAPITVANLRKRNVQPYGGPTSYKINGPEYYSYGYYKLNTGSDTVVFTDGDCYPGIFVYMSEHAFNNVLFPSANKSMVVCFVPIEADINLRATYGSIYTRDLGSSKYYYARYLAGEMDGYVQEHDMYLYNTAYNSDPYITPYSTVNYTRIDSGTFDTRVHHSDKKTNNEHIDSWGTFKPNNYLDVDTRFGEITNMRLFKDKLLYWQKDATGILSVNERTMLNDIDDNQLILGTGGTLQRFDYISTKYGMKKNQYEAEVQSNTTQYWWDGIRKEILAYAGGTELLPLTKVKSVTNYINERDEKEKPALVYDDKYNELISSVVGTKSLVYNEQVQAFTSTYTFSPIYRAVIDNTLIITDNNSIYHWNYDNDDIVLFKNDAYPLLRYVVNKNSSMVKTFDISTFGGRFYGGDDGDIDDISFEFRTPLKQKSYCKGSSVITNREYDFRLDIPRNDNSLYGDRMRGKTMQCELKSSNNSNDFSLQYIITKYRMSWS